MIDTIGKVSDECSVMNTNHLTGNWTNELFKNECSEWMNVLVPSVYPQKTLSKSNNKMISFS